MTCPLRFTFSTLLLALALSTPAVQAQTEAPVNSSMNGALLYELLLAEISANQGDVQASFQLTLDAARKSRSDQLFERAVEIACAPARATRHWRRRRSGRRLRPSHATRPATSCRS